MSLNTTGLAPLQQSGGLVNYASGNYTGDGSGTITVALGFTPREVIVFDVTDNTEWRWFDTMPAADTIVRTVSTFTLDTTGLITTNNVSYSVTVVEAGEDAPEGSGAGDGTITSNPSITYESPSLTAPQLVLASGLNTNAKVYAWMARG